MRDQTVWRPRLHICEGRGQVLSPEGDVLFEDPDWMPNALMDEGEENVLNVYFREQAHQLKYLCLINEVAADLDDTDKLSYLATRETKAPAANGYNRIQIAAADWGVPALDGGDMMSTAAEKTFGPATGATWTFDNVGLVTHATSQADAGGKFLLFIAISGETTLQINQSYKYTLRAKLV